MVGNLNETQGLGYHHFLLKGNCCPLRKNCGKTEPNEGSFKVFGSETFQLSFFFKGHKVYGPVKLYSSTQGYAQLMLPPVEWRE